MVVPADQMAALDSSLEALHTRYDPEGQMITRQLKGWNYHTDAEQGLFHEVRSSFRYSVQLLDSEKDHHVTRALKVIEKTLALQDQDTTSKSCGVWPYFEEEPLETKESPINYNWADFNAVSLLTIWLRHAEKLPPKLKEKIRYALIMAAQSIQRRDVGPGYTNIAIMGTYVTYMVSHLFNLVDMQVYAKNRLERFFDYTLDKGGFREYNSPTYNRVALDELQRMKQHISQPRAKVIIDSLYAIGWNMIARHYHLPSQQWAGPHSRSYSSLLGPDFYSILNEASEGRIPGRSKPRYNGGIVHKIPEYLMSYFLNPKYPRVEVDVFEKKEPPIIGTCYLTTILHCRRSIVPAYGISDDPSLFTGEKRIIPNIFKFGFCMISMISAPHVYLRHRTKT